MGRLGLYPKFWGAEEGLYVLLPLYVKEIHIPFSTCRTHGLSELLLKRRALAHLNILY